MAQPNEALRIALAAADRLPLKQQRQLAERLLASTASKQNSITINLRRLPQSKQTRLAELMDKNSEGKLTASEGKELKALGNEVHETMLSNSIALARAARPELFDARGRLIKRRFRQAIGIRSRRGNAHQ
jgi:hypothetical protein